jgi:hypothetical protein
VVLDSLKNVELWLWVYRENIRNHPGIHCTATAAACEAVIECLEALRREGGTRLIPGRRLAAADEAKISGGLRYRSLDALRVVVEPCTKGSFRFQARLEGERAIVELSPVAVQELVECFHDVAAGKGDSCLADETARSPRSNAEQLDGRTLPLWFWPCFGHLGPVP